jgi:hypothetical protein
MSAAPDRRAMIAKAHIAKKDLRLDDETYRAIIQRVAGAASCSACTNDHLAALLAEFRRLGWNPAPAAKRSSRKPWVRMIYGIWADLRPLLDDANEDTLRAFVKRQTRSLKNPDGIADPEWLDAPDGTRVIQGMQGWLARVRAKQTKPENADAV